MGFASVLVSLSLEESFNCIVTDFDAVTLGFDALSLILLTVFKVLKRWRILRNFVKKSSLL